MPHFILLSIILSLFLLPSTPTVQFDTLSLHDALPISVSRACIQADVRPGARGRTRRSRESETRRTGSRRCCWPRRILLDRKSTRLNCSHLVISYAVFCLKKKKHFTNVAVESILVVLET